MSTPSDVRVLQQQVNRRILLARSAAATAMSVMTSAGLVSAREARAAQAPLSVLTDDEASTLEALGDTLLPGAAEAGIAHWVDSQLASDNPRLIYIYFDYPQPAAAFYQASLVALDDVSQARFGGAFTGASEEQRNLLTGELLSGQVDGWNGPVSTVFYLSVRADSLDVVYGTTEGFASLDIPYMAHIPPPPPQFQ